MFGYVVADQSRMSKEALARYREWYCGLCRALQVRSGQFSRITLNYDITFLIMLLSSLYEPENSEEKIRCVTHPVIPQRCLRSRFTDYGADIDVALAYHNCMDDYRDDRSVARLACANLLQKSYARVGERWPRQCSVIEEQLKALYEAENAGTYDPDRAANSFGALMGELFVYDTGDFWAPTLRRMGEALGRFVYMMDACVDIERDIRRSRYNPLLRPDGTYMDREEMTQLLTVLIGECAMEFEHLPLVQDADIMRNVLYYGVWQHFGTDNKERDVTDDQRPL